MRDEPMYLTDCDHGVELTTRERVALIALLESSQRAMSLRLPAELKLVGLSLEVARRSSCAAIAAAEENLD